MPRNGHDLLAMPNAMNTLALNAAVQDRVADAPAAPAKIRLSGMADDKAMLRAAARPGSIHTRML